MPMPTKNFDCRRHPPRRAKMTPEDAMLSATTVRRCSTKGSHTFSSHTSKILVRAFLQKKSQNTFPMFYRLTLGFRKRWNPLMEAQTSLSHSNVPFTYLKNPYFHEFSTYTVLGCLDGQCWKEHLCFDGIKGSQAQIVDILDLHSKRHMAENIFLALNCSLQSKKNKLCEKICAIVTDSPSVMLKLKVSS
ncbi:hypothetical protein VP01_176g3 [Puccinia sorghi]|uniref:Uncharacterized protein n=1 Tax=Puccinia sorghi TaxID=27349 RepID=A0A0L6VFD6_9BASI|nr:hypothetical protein VP01_176g3 [Puccinia sorghi]